MNNESELCRVGTDAITISPDFNEPTQILTRQEAFDLAADFLEDWAAWVHRRWNMDGSYGGGATDWDNALTLATGLLRKGVVPAEWPFEQRPPAEIDPSAEAFWEEKKADAERSLNAQALSVLAQRRERVAQRLGSYNSPERERIVEGVEAEARESDP